MITIFLIMYCLDTNGVILINNVCLSIACKKDLPVENIVFTPNIHYLWKGTDFEGVRPKTSSGARKQETPKKSHSTTKDGHRTKTPGTPHSADTGTPSSTVSIQRHINNNLNTKCQPLAQLLNIRYMLTLNFFVLKYMSLYMF